jgi:PLP dependent protein
MADIGSRLASLRERVALAALRADRDPRSVRIMAVSKFRSSEEVRAAHAAGLRLFGESRVQEAGPKALEAFSVLEGVELHMIGHLQSNKAREAVRIFSCVQSIDSFALALVLERESRALGKSLGGFFEIHTAEESKSGFRSPEDLWKALEGLMDAASRSGEDAVPGLRPLGLMTMAPFTRDEGAVRASFRSLAALAREWGERYPEQEKPLLSMGMSNDFEIAVEEGSDMVRIGTAIFGETA